MRLSNQSKRFAALATLCTWCAGVELAYSLDFTPNEALASNPDVKILDPEFDAETSRVWWVDEGKPADPLDQSLWLGYLDPKTGLFNNRDGRGTRVDYGGILGVKSLGNGCEWVFSNAGKQIVYTKSTGESTLKDRAVARAVYSEGQWKAEILGDAEATSVPIGSLDLNDPTPHIAYQGFLSPNVPGSRDRAVFVRELTDPLSEQMIPTTDRLFTPGARWVPNSDTAIFTRPMTPQRGAHREVFTFNRVSGALRQLTDSEPRKDSVYMWNAPEYGGEKIFLALENEEYLGIYRKVTVPQGQGPSEQWERAYIVDPPASGTYIWSPEVFTVDSKSYIAMTTSNSPDQQSRDLPTEIWISGIDPDHPFYRKISDERILVRKDPEPVTLGGHLPLKAYGDPRDYTLTESLTQLSAGQLMSAGASTTSPAGGRNAIFAFELPSLDNGKSITRATFGAQLLNTVVPGQQHADLWAIAISDKAAPPIAYLEENFDPDEGALKIADNLLSSQSAANSHFELDPSQAGVLADYLMNFYSANPGYSGGSYLYLRLNPDTNFGDNDFGWVVAASDHATEPQPTLSLEIGAERLFQGEQSDYALGEDAAVFEGNQLLPVGSVKGQEPGTEGRNAILVFEVPALDSGESIGQASVTFSIGGNFASSGLKADLWAVGIYESAPILKYKETDVDPDPRVKRIANDILDETTSVNRPISLSAAAAKKLSEYLMSYYNSHPDYKGGAFLYLRLNPDSDAGSASAGWYVYSGENQPGIGPSMTLAVQSRDRVFVYVSVGGELHRLDTGLGAPPL